MTYTPTLLCTCADPECPGRVPIFPPFGVRVEMMSEEMNDAEIYLSIRTSSWEFDGERTDLHDVLSLLWAALLRVREAASVRLVTMLNPVSGSSSEIYARVLLLAQPGEFAPGHPFRERAGAISDESMVASMLGAALFGEGEDRDNLDEGYDGDPNVPWITSVRRRLRLNHPSSDCETRARSFPRWTYLGSLARGVSVVDIGAQAAAALRQGFSGFAPQHVAGVDATLIRTDKFLNAARTKTLERLAWLAEQVDGVVSSLLIIPTDSHVIAVGRKCFIAVRDPSGREQFDADRDKLLTRRADEASWLNEGRGCRWADHIDDTRFERFVGEMLAVERGISRVRQVGATREPDDGRDFMVDWVTPPDRRGETRNEDRLFVPRQVLVQVKVRQKGVGRGDLQGLRDTLEHYRCGGLLVVAYPRVTVTLINHLSELGRRGPYWVDWWGQTELEERVRRHPQIAARFSDIVTLHPGA